MSFLKKPMKFLRNLQEIDLWQLNENLITWLTTNFGGSIPKFMFQDSIIDLVANDPDHPINQGLRDNDLLQWGPTAPTRLLYCTADDQVPFMNSVVGRDSMNAYGAFDLQASDVDPTADHGGCVTPAVTAGYLFFLGFQEIGTIINTVDLDKNIHFQIAPNPANDQISINFKNGLQDFKSIELINVSGQTLKSNNTQTTMNLNDISQGIYFVKVTSENGVWIEKLVKN